MDTLEALHHRHSARSFKAAPLPLDIIQKIVDAGRMAATARNIQPWEFVVVTDREILVKIGEAADHGKFIAQAAACIAVFCADTKYYLEDGCASTQNMLVAAEALGVATCWVAGDKKTYAPLINAMLEVPERFKLVSLIPLGFENDIRPRPPKRALTDVLHWEKF